ncbi:MAG: thioredoxin domain-containing protein [Vicinamibacterales bacterium]
MLSTRCRLVLALVLSGFVLGCSRAENFTNRLIDEKSPYLQQHAHNPVAWYPWGDEAFEKARREDKAVFLSIGYSTCHWCHVMEQESFSNPAIAAVMNEHFISIKVDREERPDLDRLYMNYVIGVSEGGWPMSIFLTPDRKPFFGANYLPPDDHDGDPGFRTVLLNVAGLWRARRAEALLAAESGTQAMAQRSQATTGTATIDPAQAFDQTYEGLERTFDGAGFGGAPKFPRTAVLTFLMHYAARTGNARAQEMALATLRAMATGGIHDQLAGGFHRYATDRDWLVPHYEKMLYDQALLASAYVDGFQATRDPFFRDVARRTLDYVLRDLRDPGGAFHSAEDADSIDPATGAIEEGAYYTWTREDIRRIVGSNANLVAAHLGVGAEGRHALSQAKAPADPRTAAIVDGGKGALLRARLGRPRPAKDDKVLVAWNALMLSALARAAQAFDEPRYLDAARAQAEFIQRALFNAGGGTLLRRYRDGHADIDAMLEDYAYLVQGLLDLYETSFDPRWLTWAMTLQETQDRLFWDAEGGAYFSTAATAGDVLTRVKEEYDGAEPAANSVAAMNLLRLWKMTARGGYRDRADATFRALAPRVSRSGVALPQLLAALDFLRTRPREIVIAGDPGAADTRALLRVVNGRYLPNKVVLVADGGRRQSQLEPMAPFIEGMRRLDGRATIYVCENYACRLPTTDPAVAARLLSE